MTDTRKNETLDDARDALRAYFDATRESAPPPPAWLGAIDADRRGRVSARSVGARTAWNAAAALTVAAVFGGLLLSPRELDASPRAVVERAASGFLRLVDARLQVRMESKLLNFLDSSDDPIAIRYRVDIQRPNRFFLCGDSDAPSRLVVDTMAGYDGVTAWTYDRRENAVEVSQPDPDALDLDLTDYLGFAFVKALQERSGEYEVVEDTSTLERRAGWRAFELLPAGEPDDGSILWKSVRMVVDPARDLILRYRVEMAAGPISLGELVVELEEENVGFPPSHFRFESHVPDGATLRTSPPGEGLRVDMKVRSADGD